MLCPEILKLRSSEIVANVHFPIQFAFAKFSRGQPIYTKRGTLPESLRKMGGTCPLCSPVPTSRIG